MALCIDSLKEGSKKHFFAQLIASNWPNNEFIYFTVYI